MQRSSRKGSDGSPTAAGSVSRRDFLAAGSATAVALTGAPLLGADGPAKAPVASSAAATKSAASPTASSPESLVKVLYDTLTDKQKKEICFAWDYVERHGQVVQGRRHPPRGLLRTYVANNWHITRPFLISHGEKFYTDEQFHLVRKIWEGLVRPEWHERIDRQLADDAGGFGHEQSIALFGTPGEGKFEFVMTGRHMTIRCDGNSTEHVAFGGPIFYGHAAHGFNERHDHPGNVFWPQAQAANKLYQMLDGKQQKQALLPTSPNEHAAGFRARPAEIPGLRVADMSSDQKEHMQGVLKLLVEPYRTDDQDEALACLAKHGGLDACSLSFYRDKDLGQDGVWDNWRLEGPAFVWYFRGDPHVHVWVNVADDASVKLNA